MTHLRIELNNGVIEEVSSAVIDKLYDIVHSGTLDNTSNLIGRLHTSATYQDYIDYLEDTFKVNGVKLLIIDATKKYMSFADLVVASYWANSSYGDGTGIDVAAANSVLSIPNGAFKNNTNILTFDELGKFTNCTEIKYDAFWGCSNLESIDLSNITTFSGSNLFPSCSKLGSTNNGILNIPKLCNFGGGSGTFQSCTSLVEVNIGAQVENLNKITYIGGFSGCSNLEKVTGLNMVQAVYSSGFYNCSKLESLDFTSNLIRLDRECFFNCSSLKCIDLSGVTTLYDRGHFNGCISLIDLSTNDPTQASTSAATYTFNWSSVPLLIFVSCPLTNKSFSFPNATSIGTSAFNSSGIVSVSMPNCTVTNNSSFKGCTSLTAIDLSNLITVGDNCFSGCTSLSSITSLSSCTTIGFSAFDGCSNLDVTDLDLSNVTSVGYYAFRGCANLKGTLDLSGLTTIGSNITEQLFSGCSGLQKIMLGHMPSITTSIYNSNRSTFYGCNALEIIDINQLDKIVFTNNTLINNNVFLALVIRNTTTIPTITLDNTSGALFSKLTSSSNAKIYVDDNLYSTYINHADWSDLASHVDVISNYVAS